MAESATMNSELVPELQVVRHGARERVLPDAAEGKVEIWKGNDGFEAYGYSAAGLHWAHLPGTASFCFAADSNVVAIPEPDVPPEIVEDAYFRNVLPLVIQLRGHEVLHASAVVTRAGLLVICGVSGAGKSTFAYGLSQRGCSLWADDAVALDIDEAPITAFPVPFSLGLRSDASRFFGRESRIAATTVAARSVPFAVMTLEPALGHASRVVDITSLEPAAAFTALLPHAYFFRLSDAARNAVMLDRYLRLASSVPTFAVRFRRGLDEMPAVLDEIEERVLAA